MMSFRLGIALVLMHVIPLLLLYLLFTHIG
jgi:hypothetical protein